MRRLALIAIALVCGWAALPSAVRALTPAQQVVLFSGSAPYVGPADIVTAGWTSWAGVRGFSRTVAATGTQKGLNIRRASDSAATDILILYSGNLDVATAATFCNATTCFVAKGYDQTGGTNDYVQATAANQLQLFLSGGGSNSRPYMEATTSTQALVTGSTITPATGLVSFSTVANRAAGTGLVTVVRENGNVNRIRTKSAAANTWTMAGSSGTFDFTANDASWHAVNAVMNGASSSANVDGTSTTGTATGNTAAGTAALVGATSTTGDWQEFGFLDNVALTAAQISALQLNQKTWYATP